MSTTARRLNRQRWEWFRGASCLGALLIVAGLARGKEAASESARAVDGTPDQPATAPSRIKPGRRWLEAALDRLDVEHHWLRSHDHIAWRTGLPIYEEEGKKLTPLKKDETHCSAFAAAAADSLGINLLHPPEHSHVLLANAQFDWLPSEAGRKAGWLPAATARDAQNYANRGDFVVAVFKNPDAELAGHIAIVRPAAVGRAKLAANGPEITQAGFTNYQATDLKTGFSHHPGAWFGDGKGGVKFYYHAIDSEKLAGE